MRVHHSLDRREDFPVGPMSPGQVFLYAETPESDPEVFVVIELCGAAFVEAQYKDCIPVVRFSDNTLVLLKRTHRVVPVAAEVVVHHR